MSRFADVDEVMVDPRTARVFEHGWQTGSPTTSYALSDRPHRPSSENRRIISYRPEQVVAAEVFQGEGLLAVLGAEGGPVHVYAARDGVSTVPSIRAVPHGRTG